MMFRARWTSVAFLLLMASCIRFYRPGENGEVPARAASCTEPSTPWSADADQGQQVTTALCGDPIPVGDVFKQMRHGDTLDGALVVVSCFRHQPAVCSTPLAKAILGDLASAPDSQLSEALSAASVPDPLAADFVSVMGEARAALDGDSPSGDFVDKIDRWTKARDAFWEPRKELLASAIELSNSVDGRLDEAIELRDRLVRECIDETEFSSRYCWHGNVVRRLTEQILPVAEKEERYVIAKLEHMTLTQSASFDGPSLLLRLLLDDERPDKRWIARQPEAPHKYDDKSKELFEKVVVTSQHIEKIAKAKDVATLFFLKTVSEVTSAGACKEVIVQERGRLKVKAICPPGRVIRRDVEHYPPVRVQLSDVIGLEVGHSAYVIQSDAKAVGRVLWIRDGLSREAGTPNQPDLRWRIAEVRAAVHGLP
jgi:hypothetical protein